MFKKLLTLALALSLSAVMCTPAKAIDMKMNGVFKTWSISQNDFRFGKDDINDWYTVSLVRLKPNFSAFDGDVQINLRMDLAQGWWGIDNERGGFKNLMGVRRTHSGTANGLFNGKDTNYPVHVDEAWIDIRLPFTDSFAPSRMHLGREYITLGNKLVLDYELDGVNFVTKWTDTTSTKLGYALLAEGYQGLSDNKASQNKWDALGEGAGVSGGNSYLGYLQLKQKLPEKYGDMEVFFMGYQDTGTDDGTAYLNDDLDYSDARFHPQIGTLFALGLAGNLNLDGGMITVKFEADGLVGKDPINNRTYNSNGLPNGEATGVGTIFRPASKDPAATADSSGTKGIISDPGKGTISNQARGSDGRPETVLLPGYTAQHFWNRLDKNDGDINGWNFYADAQFHYFDVDYNTTPGIVIGAGSGDDDKSGGNGNVNKLITEGWFYICEVWEDSIMPDLTGITPQGLGAPWSRGYREFENQVLVQANNNWKFLPKWNLFLSYTWVHALNNIYAWEDEPVNHNRPGIGGAKGAGINPKTGKPFDPNNDFLDSTGHSGADPVTGIVVDNGNGRGGYGNGGFDTARSSKDLGHEIDFRIEYTIFPKLVMEFRGGYFFSGDAASYLIAGARGWDRNAWEGRWDVTYAF